MRFGLDENIIEKIIKVFEDQPKVDKAYIFGSRAKGNYRSDSDIDIAVKGYDLTVEDILKISAAIEKAAIGFEVDLVDYDAIKEEELKKHVDRIGMKIYSKWKRTKIADAPLEIIDGDRSSNYPSQKDLLISGECLFLSTKNVRSNGFDFTENQFISKEKDLLLKKGKLKRNDVVLTTRGTVGNLGFYSESVPYNCVRINSGMVILRPDTDKLLPNFNYYLFQNLQSTFSTYTSGSAQPQLPIKDLKLIQVEIPSMVDQIAISSLLNSLDDKISLLHRQNKTLESMAEALFRQWFIEEEQKEWRETNLESHIIAHRGLSYNGDGLTDQESGSPMHNLNSVYEGGGYKYSGIKYYSGEFKERHLVHPGDIIIANTEQGHEHKLIGYPAVIPDYYGSKGIFSQHIYKLSLLPNSYLTNEFIYYLLMTPSIREQIIGATNGSTVNMLALDGLQRPTFKLPPEERIEEFSKIVTDYWRKENNNYRNIQGLIKLRDTLLPKLLSGEARIKMS